MKKMDQLRDYSGGGGLEDWLAFKARANYLNVLLSNCCYCWRNEAPPPPYNQRDLQPKMEETFSARNIGKPETSP